MWGKKWGSFSAGGGSSSETSHVVTVPVGAWPGSTIQVRIGDGDGELVSVQVPRGAMPGSSIRVTQSTKVRVEVPANVEVGDQMKGRAPDGSSFMFTVPPGRGRPGRRGTRVIDVAVPRATPDEVEAELSTDRRPAEDEGVKTIRVRVPRAWDGRELLVIEHAGRTVLMEVPRGAERGDELLLDLPGRSKLSLQLRVPLDYRGTGEVAVRAPSGKLVLVQLSRHVRAGDDATVELVDEEPEYGSYGGFGGGPPPQASRGKGTSAGALGRAASDAGTTLRAVMKARFSNSRAQLEPVFKPLAQSGGGRPMPQAGFHALGDMDDDDRLHAEILDDSYHSGNAAFSQNGSFRQDSFHANTHSAPRGKANGSPRANGDLSEQFSACSFGRAANSTNGSSAQPSTPNPFPDVFPDAEVDLMGSTPAERSASSSALARARAAKSGTPAIQLGGVSGTFDPNVYGNV